MTTTERPAIEGDDKTRNRVWRPPVTEWKANLAPYAARTRRGARYGLHQAWVFIKTLIKLVLVYSWRGAGRVAMHTSRWIYDMDSAKLRHEHAGKGDTAEAAKAQAIRKANLHARFMVASTALIVVLFPVLVWTAPVALAWVIGFMAALWVAKLIPGKHWGEFVAAAVIGTVIAMTIDNYLVLVPEPPAWPFAVLGVAVVIGLGYLGRNPNRPILKTTVAANVTPPLRAPLVVKALTSLGIKGMSEKTEEDPRTQIRLLQDMHRDGPGVRGDFELPEGVRAADVVAKREAFASGVRRELGCVWPAVGPRHPGHLIAYVTDVPMVKAPQKPWPLRDGKAVDIFEPQPMVTDRRGQWVDVTLAYANMVIGAMPRMGKTFLLREALLVAALDVRTRLYCLDGKGTGDLAPLRLVAHFYSVGDDSDEVEGKVLPALRALREEMRARAKKIRELPKEEAPESKVTTELAGRREFAPIVVGIDETQAYFGYGDLKGNKRHADVRAEITSIVTDLVKRGPALGIIVLMATQNVCELTIPRQISTNAVYRAALKLFDDTTNNQVLGNGAYSKGYDATSFDVTDKGLMWLLADGGEPTIARSVVGLDVIESERIAAIARARRDRAGRLTGEAAGEEIADEQQQVDLLADCRDVMDNLDGGRVALHLSELREVLADLRPNLYGHLDNDSLGGLLREAGVRVASVHSPALKTSAKGIRREWLEIAATADVDPDDGPAAA